MAEIDLLRLSVLVRDAVLNSRPKHQITTFETTKIEIDGHPARMATLPVPKITQQLRGVDDFDGIDITIEASGHDAVSKLVDALSGTR